MKKALVLGSAGQIGNALLNYLGRNGISTTGLDIAYHPSQDLRLIPTPNVQVVKAINETDFVYFLAFDVGGSRYLRTYQDTYEFIDNNSRIMVNTFEILKVTKKPFIFASSQMSNMVHSSYGILKALGEAYTRALGGLSAKFWNVYGYETDWKKFHVITDFIIKARTEGRIRMESSGKEERQFLHVDDACVALKHLGMLYREVDRDIPLHITSFKWTTIMDVARIIAKQMGNVPILGPKNAPDDTQEGYKNEPSDEIFKYWRPKISLEAGIKKVVDQYAELYRNPLSNNTQDGGGS